MNSFRLKPAKPSPTKPGKRGHRHGAVLLIVVGCLAVVAVVAAGLMRYGAQSRQLARRQQREMQARWLAESGVSRAAARLAADAGYTGETWRLTATELGGRDGATVDIQVEIDAVRPRSRTVRVTADLADEPGRRARHVKRITLETRQPNSAEEDRS